MAIDPTRGLPSFSEMYSAYKNQGSLAEGISGGVKGYTDAKAANSKSNLEAANAKEALAHAGLYDRQASGGIEKRIPLAALPEGAKAALGQYADEMGTITESQAKIYLANTAQGAASDKAGDELAHKQELLRVAQENAEKNRSLSEQLAALQAEAKARTADITAATNLTSAAEKVDEPSMFGKYVASPIKEAVTGQPLESVLAQRQAQAGRQKLSELAGVTGQPLTPAPSASELGVNPPTGDMIARPAPAERKRIFPQRGQATGKESSPVTVKNQADYDKLPVGAWFVDSTGKPTQKKGR